MSTLVVAISRQLGSGGAYIGQIVARRLGLKYVDHDILQQAARLLGCEDRDLVHFEERAASLWETAGRVFSAGSPDVIYLPPSGTAVYEADLFRMESRIIQEIARTESAVIVGRGGSYVLRDHPGLVAVFVHAPVDWRIARLARMGGAADLREVVEGSDRQRGRFVQNFTGREWTNATNYHLAVNTAAVGLETAVDLVANLASARLSSLRDGAQQFDQVPRT